MLAALHLQFSIDEFKIFNELSTVTFFHTIKRYLLRFEITQIFRLIKVINYY